MKTLGVIPARLGSTRLARKMILPINGKPLIYWTWKQVMKAKKLDKVVVATDAKEIFDIVTGFGGEAVMTSVHCTSGSDRVAETAKKFPWATYVVNIQGDEPMVSPGSIDAVVQELHADRKVLMATVAKYTADKEDIESPGNVRIVLDKNRDALYFSRSVIPYPRNACEKYIKHIGIYGFRREFLAIYAKMKPTFLEKTESLEQLRALENGYKIRVAIGNYVSVSVDTLGDLKRVRNMMKK